MMSFKSKSAKRAVVAAVGTVAVLGGATVAAAPASASYSATCSPTTFNVYKTYTYSLSCSHFPSTVGGSVYEKIDGNSIILGRFTTTRAGEASTGFVVSTKLPIGVQAFHVAAGGKLYAFNVRVRRTP